MNDIMKTTIPLFIICAVTGLCLSYVNSVTKAPIQERIKEAAELKKTQVLSSAKNFEDVKDLETITGKNSLIKAAFKGIDSGKIIGYVFNVSVKGYAGSMDVTVGISINGSVTGVRLGENKETPGLGSKAGEMPFLNQYTGKKAGETFELVKKPPAGNQVQAISGATISSRAVTGAVQTAADCFNKIIKKEAAIK